MKSLTIKNHLSLGGIKIGVEQRKEEAEESFTLFPVPYSFSSFSSCDSETRFWLVFHSGSEAWPLHVYGPWWGTCWTEIPSPVPGSDILYRGIFSSWRNEHATSWLLGYLGEKKEKRKTKQGYSGINTKPSKVFKISLGQDLKASGDLPNLTYNIMLEK